MRRLLHRARRARWIALAVVNLRILLGYAFVPAGLKKILDQPFTDPANTGAFHEFLHAFHATGAFYQLVGGAQLSIGVLLMTQRFAAAGAFMALPVFATITAFCWSTRAYFTAVMVTLMLLGTIALVMWDLEKWRGLLHRDPRAAAPSPAAADAAVPVDQRLWGRCGAAILIVYLAICLHHGGIYRPVGVELDNPAFYTFPLIALLPVTTFVIEQRQRRRAGPASSVH